MNAPTLTRIEQLRARDGDRCWLCDGKLDFAAASNSTRAPTVEHLVAKSNGGTNALANLVLTHPGCNKQLGVRPIEQKHKMRAKNRANRERVAAARKVRFETPVEDGGNLRPGVSPSPRSGAAAKPTKSTTHALIARYKDRLWRWQVAALCAGGAALLLAGVLLGTTLTR